jgi:chromate reductase, NAD(P)H dehydrogenase (quinone)
VIIRGPRGHGACYSGGRATGPRLGIAGSLRSGSYNRRILEAATDLLPEADWAIARIRAVPPFDADVEARGLPPAVGMLKAQIGDADAVEIVTPEYNASIPGVLKNAIDWASRPAHASPFADKPVVLVGASPGRRGARRALEHLTQVMESMDARMLGEPLSIPLVRDRFADGELDDRTRRDLRRVLEPVTALKVDGGEAALAVR